MTPGDDMPAQPKTTETAAVPQWAADLIVSVRSGFTSVNQRLDGLEGTDKTLANEVARVTIAVEDLRAADRRHEDDLRRLSERTKDTSANASSADLAHESRLAQEIVARQAIESKVDALTASQEVQLAILGRLDKIATNPHVKLILAVVATALMSWAASKGLK